MAGFRSEGEYLAHVSHHALMPDGFSIRTSQIEFDPPERPGTTAHMNITTVQSDRPMDSFAGVFTTNRLPGAPVIVTRQRMEGASVRGILVNNKVANVGVRSGVADAELLSEEVAGAIDADPDQILVASTGVIGWRLPVDEMRERIRSMPADDDRRPHGGRLDALDLARAIMTTDSYPKVAGRSVGAGRIVGVAKGAGMIEPHMATMLSFIFTDLAVDRRHLAESLRRAVADSFNTISVDGDQSTSDMVLVLSSGLKPCRDLDAFDSALGEVCMSLAEDVVRNGEGVAHVLEVSVEGAPDDEIARELARAVANSPLVKTAVFGNDPNVGRIIMAIGDFCGRRDLDPSGLSISIGDRVVYEDGSFRLDGETEELLSEYLRSAAQDPTIKGYRQSDATVDVAIRLDAGGGRGRIWGSDLSYEYVRENADYRT